MRRYITLLLLIIVCIGTITVQAQSLSWTCPIDHRTFYFDPRDRGYMEKWIQIHLNSHSSTASPAAVDPVIQALSPAMQTLFNSIGQDIANWLFGNKQEQARIAELRRLEEVRLAEDARLYEARRSRMRAELHQRLLSELKLLPSNELSLKGIDQEPLALKNVGGSASPENPLGLKPLEGSDGSELRPKGTAFFGLGGDRPSKEGQMAGVNDPMVVDLRHLRQAAYLAQAATKAGPADAEFLMDQALQVADGDEPFVVISNETLPIVNEKGLLAFQQANNEYRLARDTHLKASQAVVDAERSLQVWSEAVRRLKAELEGAESRKPDVSQQHRLLAELLAAEKRLLQERLKARVESDKSQSNVAWCNDVRRLAVRSLVASEQLPFDVLKHEREQALPGTVEQFLHRSAAMEALRQYQSQQMDERLASSYGFVQDSAAHTRIEGIIDRLRAVSAFPNEPVRVRILDLPKDPSVERGKENGVFAKGGTIYIGRKFLEGKPSDEELTFFLGHELGHIHHDHATRQYLPVAVKTLQAEWQYSASFDPSSTLTPENKEWIRHEIFASRIADYLRAQEFEADRYGALLSLSSGVRPEAIRNAFKRIQEIESIGLHGRTAAGLKLIELTREHASPSDRYEELRRLWGARVLPELAKQ